MLSAAAHATNGDNLIGVGPVSRAMGGVGIAAPQDAISAVFSNPAAMCFGPVCKVAETDFAGTLFMPKVDAKITNFSGTITAESDDKIYAIPAIGVSVPITSGPRSWRFGLAAYGVTGLGVDYRGTSIDNPNFFGPGAPLVAGEFTQLQIMKFAPAISFLATEKLSFGLALHIDYSSLDLRSGASFNYGFGAQAGAIFKPTTNWSLGLNYITPQSVDHQNVLNLNGNLSDLELASPHQLGVGVGYEFSGIDLLLEFDVKWLGWSSAKGYEDFDWEDQWVYAVGAQYRPIPKLVLRAGYNYAKNPVREHNGFNGAPTSTVNVQGTVMPTYYYETFRVIGFPAIVEHHITLGLGYDFTNSFSLHCGFMYAVENTIRESGTDFSGNPVTLESSLSETGLDFGFIWRF